MCRTASFRPYRDRPECVRNRTGARVGQDRIGAESERRIQRPDAAGRIKTVQNEDGAKTAPGQRGSRRADNANRLADKTTAKPRNRAADSAKSAHSIPKKNKKHRRIRQPNHPPGRCCALQTIKNQKNPFVFLEF